MKKTSKVEMWKEKTLVLLNLKNNRKSRYLTIQKTKYNSTGIFL